MGIKLGFYRMNPDVQIPGLGTSMSACFDLRFCPTQDAVYGYDKYNLPVSRYVDKSLRVVGIHPGDRLLVPTGLVFKIEAYVSASSVKEILNRYSIRLHARSGLALKRGLVLSNSEGIVDVDYQQEVFVMLTNVSDIHQDIEFQERIAQAEIVRNEGFTLTELSAKPEAYSERNGGFGSTGTA